MTETKIPDFTDNELWIVRSTLSQRYGKEAAYELADAELRLDPESHGLTSCPTVFWSERGANFVLSKVGESAYRCLSYRGYEQFGTGRETYDDLAQCVITLLQVQADHERQKKQTGAASTNTDSPRSH